MTSISLLLGFFNIVAGVMLVGAVLLFLGGFINYLILLGVERRNVGLVMMFWGVTILFVLVVLMAIIDVLQGPIAFLIGIGVVLFICFVIVITLAKPKSPKPEGDDH